jgi:glutathione S-transferase
MSTKPYLLYVYPWMPFPRRVIIYLREKGIRSSLVTTVPVSDPQLGDSAPPTFPPRPAGSLPILAIPSTSKEGEYTYIRQSVAIINYLDELCNSSVSGFPKSKYAMRGHDILSRARETELLALAEELLVAWNPVRTFGTGAGTMSIPEAAKEMLRWEYRGLAAIESQFADRDFSYLKEGGRGPSIAEIIFYGFLEFTKDCYGVDVTKGSGETTKDVYGREVVLRYEKIEEFFDLMGKRKSVVRDAENGEVPGEAAKKAMSTWAEGIL